MKTHVSQSFDSPSSFGEASTWVGETRQWEAQGSVSTSTSYLPLPSSSVPPSRITHCRSMDTARSIDTPQRLSSGDESARPRDRTLSQQSLAYANRQYNISTTSLSLPSIPEHHDLIRTATSMLCKEVAKPPQHMSRTVAGLKDWEEVEVRVRALARLERIWGKSGIGGSSSNLSLGATGKERERRLFTEALRDGFVLCQCACFHLSVFRRLLTCFDRLMNKLRSSSIVRPNSRDDGFVRTSNITQFLAACSSYGLPNEDLFQRDDLIEATSESLARVAKTIIALIRYVAAPTPALKHVSGQANTKPTSPSLPLSLYGKGSSRSAATSTPNLPMDAPPPPPTLTRKRWSPPSDLPTVRSNSRRKSSGSFSDDQPATAGDGTNQHARMVQASITDREVLTDKEMPPPRSPPRLWSFEVEEGQPGLFGYHAGSPRVSTSSKAHSISSAMTETTTSTTMSRLFDVASVASTAPSIVGTEGSAIGKDFAQKHTELEAYSQETRLIQTLLDHSRVREMNDSGTASRGISRKWEKQQLGKPASRLGKGKWPEDFMDPLQPPKSPTTDFRSPSQRKLAIIGATQRNENVESLPQFPRQPTHRARHSINVPVQLMKDSVIRRDNSASDLLARDSLDGSLARKTLVVKEEGKAPAHFVSESVFIGDTSNASYSKSAIALGADSLGLFTRL